MFSIFSHSHTLLEANLFKDFTEWHCHLLPGVDDGAPDMDKSLRLLRRMEEVGVKCVHLTPHIMEDYPNTPESLNERFSELQTAYQGNIELHLAAEQMLDNLFTERLDEGRLMTLHGDKVLVETSYYNPPYQMDNVLRDIIASDHTPVLAHPERYTYMEVSDYERLKGMGILFQLNLGSLVGLYGPQAQKKAHMLIKHDWYDLCGTDTHSMHFYERLLQSKLKTNILDDVHRIIEKSINSTFAD
ncbi:MAG: tyrosine-protein phosphatase [Prevotella sp.]|jgi:protein-tyrosine phosphatase